jgi:hypothetical protein
MSLSQTEKVNERVLLIIHTADKKFEITFMEINNEDVSLDIPVVINQSSLKYSCLVIPKSTLPSIFGWTFDY